MILRREKVFDMKKEEKCCGNCHWFNNEDAYGVGWCSINDRETSCDKVCILTDRKSVV